MKQLHNKIAFGVFVVIFCLSCEGEDETNNSVREAPDLTGSWNITGEGEQSGCANFLDNYVYRFTLSSPFLVAAQPTNMEGEELTWGLSLSQNNEGIQNFTGTAGEGDLVEFSFEDVSEMEMVSYQFSGQIKSAKQLEGEFSANGPGSCMTINDGARLKISIE